MFAFWNFGNHCIKASKNEKNKQTNKQTLKQKRPHDFRESAIDDYRENAKND